MTQRKRVSKQRPFRERYGKDWEKVRARVFALHGRSCYRCGAYANTVDHIVALALGGTHDLGNLRPACEKCNKSTGATLGNKLRGARRDGSAGVQWRSSRDW